VTLSRHQIKDDGRSSSVKEASVTALQTDALELTELWSETDPDRRARFNFPISLETGAASTAVVYFEVPPGKHLGQHTDSAEEVLFIRSGRAEAVVGEERLTVAAGGLALVPAMVPHDVINVGDEPVQVVGFFSSSTVISVFDEPFAPIDAKVFVTPPVDQPEPAAPA